MSRPACRLCAAPEPEVLLDFGPQPVTSRYLKDAAAPEFAHPMRLGLCRACGLLQLLEPMPARELTPVYDWISYREPDSHLKNVASIIASLPGVDRDAVVVGVGESSPPLLKALQEAGFASTRVLDGRELGLGKALPGNELVQEGLEAKKAAAAADKTGRADVVLALRIFEHAYDPARFIAGCAALLKPGGRLVVEVPDTRNAFEQLDFTALWEDHVSYFTADSFRRALAILGFRLERFAVYPYPQEDSLVAIVQAGETPAKPAPAPRELEDARAFARAFAAKKEEALRLLASHRARGGAALLGAGHRACAFVNLFGLKDGLRFVVDDDARKKGLFMPGSRLPILSSEALIDKGVSLCLLGINPEAEDKVAAKNRAFALRGGLFQSIFSISPRSFSGKVAA